MSTTHIEGRWRGRRPRARHGGAKRRSAEGVGSGEGRRSPSPVWWSGGIAPVWGHCPQKILKFNSANLFIFSTISRHFATSHNTLQQSQLHTWQSQLHTLCQKTHNFRPCYKILFGCVVMHRDEFFVLSLNLQTRGHHYKLFKQRSNTRVRSSFFTERVINILNSLPSDTVNFSSLGAFKRSLQLVNFDKFLRYSLID